MTKQKNQVSSFRNFKSEDREYFSNSYIFFFLQDVS